MHTIAAILGIIGTWLSGWSVLAPISEAKDAPRCVTADVQCCAVGGRTCRLLCVAGDGCRIAGVPMTCKSMAGKPCAVSCSIGSCGGPNLLSRLAITLAMGATNDTDAQAQPAGWLGVVLSPLPDPLAKHLELENVGIMITNVVDDSPAAEAGLEQFDVILEVDGHNVVSFKDLKKLLAERGAGTRVELKVIRGSDPMSFEVVLGEQPEDVTYRYEVHPDKIIKQELKALGRIIRKDKSGDWVVEDLGEIDDWSPFIMHLPQLRSLGKSLRIQSDDDYQEMTIRVQEDGEAIEIEVRPDEDPQITIRRIDEEDGVERVEEKQYADEEELREEDPEAYGVLKGARPGGCGKLKFRFHHPGFSKVPQMRKEWALELKRSMEESQEAWHEALEEALEAYREVQPEINEARRHFEEMREQWGSLWEDSGGKWPGPRMRRGRIHTTITEEPSGEIRITTRKGDTEFTRVYQDADELRERDEHLYRKYEKMLEAQESEDE